MPKLFAYGPDSLQARIYDRIGAFEVVGPALLEDYALRFDKPQHKVKSEGSANLTPETGARAFGILCEVTRKQLEMLEGYYGGYGLSTVRVRPIDEAGAPGSPVSCEAFIARRTARSLKPSAAAKQATLDGANENAAPADFIAEVEALEVSDD